jgi:hypothetical protein
MRHTKGTREVDTNSQVWDGFKLVTGFKPGSERRRPVTGWGCAWTGNAAFTTAPATPVLWQATAMSYTATPSQVWLC